MFTAQNLSEKNLSQTSNSQESSASEEPDDPQDAGNNNILEIKVNKATGKFFA